MIQNTRTVKTSGVIQSIKTEALIGNYHFAFVPGEGSRAAAREHAPALERAVRTACYYLLFIQLHAAHN